MGLGELNIGGGGIGPISDNGMGGSGSSDSVNVSKLAVGGTTSVVTIKGPIWASDTEIAG